MQSPDPQPVMLLDSLSLTTANLTYRFRRLSLLICVWLCSAVSAQTLTSSPADNLASSKVTESTITLVSDSLSRPTGSALAQVMRTRDLGLQRQQFTQALEALGKRDFKTYRTIAKSLDDYPLFSYLEYRYYLRQPQKINAKIIERFKSDYEADRLADYLLEVWLKRLKANGAVKTFLNHFQKSVSDDELTCYYLDNVFRRGYDELDKELAIAQWSKPRSMPAQCDYAFSLLISKQLIDEASARARYLGARKAKNRSLSNYLFRFLGDNDQKNASLLENIEKTPKQLADYRNELYQVLETEGNEQWAKTLFNASKPFFRQEIDKTSLLLSEFKQRIEKTNGINNGTEHQAGLQAFYQDAANFVLTRAALADLAAYSSTFKKLGSPQTEVALNWQARSLIQNAQWRKLVQLIDKFPDAMRLDERWRYWSLRATQLGGRLSAEQREALTLLSQEPNFYGFAASVAMNKPVQVRPLWQGFSLEQQEIILQNQIFRRAIEFYIHGIYSHANADWHTALKPLNQEERTVAAYIASELGWHNQAISTAARAKIWRHYGVRFPDYRIEAFTEQANRYQVPVEWLYATARQESALNPLAKSSADARGLMQLLPSTAKQTASKLDLAYTESMLSNPDYNIRLGSAYLTRMFFRFNNKALASAAYNAGPHRVDKWLANMDREIPLDAWIETIRFNETRQYVQNIMSFGLIKRALNVLKEDIAHSKNASLIEFNFMVGSEATVKPKRN